MCDRHSRPRRSPRALARALAGAAMAVSMLIASGTVQAAEEPVRVAALVPFVEDAVGRMDAERIVVVASVRRSMTRPVAEGLVDLGNPHSPDLERLMMSGADLVVGDAIVHAAKKEELGRGGAEVVLIDTSSIDSALAGLVELASRAGAGDAHSAGVRRR